jgi:dCTP deaminase
MSILVDHQLRYRGPEILTPFDPEMVQPSSIDLRLGTSFRVARHHALEVIDLARVPAEDEITERVEVPLYKRPCPICLNQVGGAFCDPRCQRGTVYDEAGRIVIHPGEAMLGSTLERITVPDDLVMALEGKSSLARLFLIPHVQAGYFDPGWDGIGTLELVNLSRVPIVLRPGLKICQSRWMTLDAVPARPYGAAGLGSHYQGAAGVDGSRYQG